MRLQVAFEGVNGWRGTEWQMAGAKQRKEREQKLMFDGVGKRQCWYNQNIAYN